MAELEAFSQLVEKIYDCALDASLWPDALEAACGFVDGCTANIFYQNIETNHITVFHSWGEDEHYRQLYIERYAHLNPLFPASSFLEVGKVHAVGEIIDYDEFRATRMYQEWVKPQGILDALYANLERSATGAAAIAFRRLERDGLFTTQSRERCELLVPHVRRAVAIGRVVDFHKANQEALSKTLDGLHAAVLLVAADGRIVHVNEAGGAMLTKSDILRAPRGRVSAVDPIADKELQEAISAAGRGDKALGVKGAAISLASDVDGAQIAHVLSLASRHRRDMVDRAATAALFVRRNVFYTPAPLEIIAQLHGLTASEVRVLAVVPEANGVVSMANMLGLAEGTVKTHLRRIFQKTETHRQADLVKLLARYASPLKT